MTLRPLVRPSWSALVAPLGHILLLGDVSDSGSKNGVTNKSMCGKPNNKPPPKSQYIPKWKLFMELGESTWIFWHKCGNQPAQDVCSCRVSKICYDKHVTVEDGNDLPCMSGCYIRLCPTQKNTFFCPRNRETHWESYGGLSNAHGRRPTFLWGMVGIFLFHDLRRH